MHVVRLAKKLAALGKKTLRGDLDWAIASMVVEGIEACLHNMVLNCGQGKDAYLLLLALGERLETALEETWKGLWVRYLPTRPPLDEFISLLERCPGRQDAVYLWAIRQYGASNASRIELVKRLSREVLDRQWKNFVDTLPKPLAPAEVVSLLIWKDEVRSRAWESFRHLLDNRHLLALIDYNTEPGFAALLIAEKRARQESGALTDAVKLDIEMELQQRGDAAKAIYEELGLHL
ncbi:MAG: hypothetical protein V1763_01400 [Parcubacteria group bacterium]